MAMIRGPRVVTDLKVIIRYVFSDVEAFPKWFRRRNSPVSHIPRVFARGKFITPRPRQEQEPDMLHRTVSVTFASLLTLGLASGAMAEQPKTSSTTAHPAIAHPRVNEVERRVANQEHRIAEGLDHGQIDHWQAERDRRREEWVERQLRRDEMMHDGHITMGEEHRLNRELDHDAAIQARQIEWAEQRRMNQIPDPHQVMSNGSIALTAPVTLAPPSDPNTIHITTTGQ
jgi:hypothetical protein